MTFWKQPLSFILNAIMTWLEGLGIPEPWPLVIEVVIGAFVLVMVTMLFVIFLIWYERKLIGRFQDRFGPNRLGPWGIFQPFADMLKIFTKEYITPRGADWFAYNFAPPLMVGGVLLIWAAIPISSAFAAANLSNGALYLFAVGGFGAVAIILAGWGSNNKYSLLAGLRAVALLITFEVPHILTALIPVMFAGSLNLMQISSSQTIWNAFLVPAAAVLFFFTSVAEIGRAPFDMTEAESELIGGFNTEYSGLKFGMFFVGEFLHAFTSSVVFSVFFLGGWNGPGAEAIPALGFIYLIVKTFIVYFVMIWFRGTNLRFRIDQMLAFSWKFMTPLAITMLIVSAVVNKLVVDSHWIIRLLLVAGTNIAAFLLFNYLLGKNLKTKKVPAASAIHRPVARPENVFTES